MFDGRFRRGVDSITAPVGRQLVRAGVSADVLTFSGLVFAVATAWAIGAGYNWLAIILLTTAGFHDLLDGAVAKASHRASQRGSFYDSVVDRVADVLYVLALYVVGATAWVCVLAATVMFLQEYARARAAAGGSVPAGRSLSCL